MKVSQEQQDQDMADYAAAFGDEMAPPPEAGDEMPGAEAAETPAEESNGVDSEAEMAGNTAPGEAQAEPPAAEAAAAPEMPAEPAAEPGAADDEPTDPVERQQYKSWVGRLKAMEAKLKAREDALAARESAGAGEERAEQAAEALEKVAEVTDNPDLAKEALGAAEKVENGQMTYDQAAKMLSEDFGGDFVALIKTIAAHEAGQSSGPRVAQLESALQQISQAFGQLVTELNDRDMNAHKRAITRAHADADEVAGSDGFRAYILAMPEAERADAERVINEGEADEIIALLNAFKKSHEQMDNPDAETADAPDESALDAAEGVRSAGLKLPEQPVASGGSYEDAWSQF